MIVVCAPDQELPPLPDWVQVVRDPEPGLGPLAGLATGLAVAGTRAEVAAVSAVDAPLAHPAVLAALIGALGTSPAVLPLGGQRPQPLFAVYRTELAFLAAALVADGERRAASLGERWGARVVEPFELLVVDDIAAFDPGLASLLSFDHPRSVRSRARVAAAARDRHGRPRRAARVAGLHRRACTAPAARRRRAAARRRRPGRRRDAALRGRRPRARVGLVPAPTGAPAGRPRSA